MVVTSLYVYTSPLFKTGYHSHRDTRYVRAIRFYVISRKSAVNALTIVACRHTDTGEERLPMCPINLPHVIKLNLLTINTKRPQSLPRNILYRMTPLSHHRRGERLSDRRDILLDEQ